MGKISNGYGQWTLYTHYLHPEQNINITGGETGEKEGRVCFDRGNQSKNISNGKQSLTETRENIVFADFWREATSIIDSFVRRCMSHVKAELSAYR